MIYSLSCSIRIYLYTTLQTFSSLTWNVLQCRILSVMVQACALFWIFSLEKSPTSRHHRYTEMHSRFWIKDYVWQTTPRQQWWSDEWFELTVLCKINLPFVIWASQGNCVCMRFRNNTKLTSLILCRLPMFLIESWILLFRSH